MKPKKLIKDTRNPFVIYDDEEKEESEEESENEEEEPEEESEQEEEIEEIIYEKPKKKNSYRKSFEKTFKSSEPRVKNQENTKSFKRGYSSSSLNDCSPDTTLLEIKKLELRISKNEILLQKLKNEILINEYSFREKEVESVLPIVLPHIQEHGVTESTPVLEIQKNKKLPFFRKSKQQSYIQENKQVKNLQSQTPFFPVSSPDNVLLSENLTVPKRCPKCNKRLKKSKVFEEEGNLTQVIKCRNKNCDWIHKINIKPQTVIRR